MNASRRVAGFALVRWLAMLTPRLDLDRIRAARRVIDPIFLNTPLYPCDALGRRLGCT